MKKLVFLCLMTLILACFTACGSGNDDNTSKNSQSSESELSWEEQQALEQKKWEDHWTNIFADTWIPRADDKELGEVVINKDGTCMIAGNTYTYKYDYASESSCSCYAYDGETLKYSFSYTKADSSKTNFEDRFEKLSIMVPNGENSYTTADGGGMFYRKSSYEGIEITAENWDTYFEFVTDEKTVTNEFGDLDIFYRDSYYKIKDEYNNRVNSYLSDVIFEIELKECNYDLTVDIANKTYSLGERDNDREEIRSYTYTFTEGHYKSHKEISYQSNDTHGCYIHADRDYVSGYLEEINVLRSMGTLYLLVE